MPALFIGLLPIFAKTITIKKMTRYCFFLKGLLCCALGIFHQTLAAQPVNISSPDGRMNVVVTEENGKLFYEVSRDNVSFLEKSPLGVVTNVADWSQGLTIVDSETKNVSDSYSLRTIKQGQVDYQATETVCKIGKGTDRVMDIIFRVSNRDVAYRYRLLPQGQTLAAVVMQEVSSFVLPEGTTTFLCPQSKPMGGFARTSPSYETPYTLDDAMGKNGWGEGYTFPCLFRIGDRGWVLISETGTDGSYVGCRLLNDHDNRYRIGFPQEG